MLGLRLLGQIPGADEAIKAASQSPQGWVAVVFVALVLAGFGTFGYVIKHLLREASDRETRLSKRINELEDFIRGDLMAQLKESSSGTQKLLAACEAICSAAADMSDAIAHCRLNCNYPETTKPGS